jgi:hypothetical protein
MRGLDFTKQTFYTDETSESWRSVDRCFDLEALTVVILPANLPEVSYQRLQSSFSS